MINNIKSNTISEADTKKKINELNEIKNVETKGKRLIKIQEKLLRLFDDLVEANLNNNDNNNNSNSSNNNNNENDSESVSKDKNENESKNESENESENENENESEHESENKNENESDDEQYYEIKQINNNFKRLMKQNHLKIK